MTGPPSHRTEVRNRRWEWDSTCCPSVHQDGRGGSLAAMIDNPDIRDLADEIEAQAKELEEIFPR